jgi:hypothetical protein
VAVGGMGRNRFSVAEIFAYLIALPISKVPNLPASMGLWTSFPYLHVAESLLMLRALIKCGSRLCGNHAVGFNFSRS